MLNSSPDPVTPLVLEKNLISEINSMMKESKTANVNISTCSSEASANNEICFDSGKFPQSELAKPRAAVASTLVRNTDNAQLLSQQQQQQLAQKSKVKMTNVLKEAAKRLSEDQSSPSSSTSCTANEAGLPSDQSLLSPNNENSGSKRPRFESGGNQEASASRQINRNGAVSPWESLGALGALGSLGTAVKDEEPSTSSHVACLPSSSLKESIVTQTFQGQFRSTVRVSLLSLASRSDCCPFHSGGVLHLQTRLGNVRAFHVLVRPAAASAGKAGGRCVRFCIEFERAEPAPSRSPAVRRHSQAPPDSHQGARSGRGRARPAHLGRSSQWGHNAVPRGSNVAPAFDGQPKPHCLCLRSASSRAGAHASQSRLERAV